MKYSATKFYKIVERDLVPMMADAIENAVNCLEEEEYVRGLKDGYEQSMLIFKTLHMHFSNNQDDDFLKEKGETE